MLISLKSVFTAVLLIALGFFLNERRYFSKKFIDDISKFLINISLPTALFVSVIKTLNIKILLSVPLRLILYPLISLLINYILAYMIMKFIKVERGRRGTFINTVVHANIIFIGIGVNRALFGDEAMPYFLLYYLVNTVSMWFAGSFIIANDKIGDKKSNRNIKLMLPSVISLTLALVCAVFTLPVSDFIRQPLEYLGNITIPFGFIYIGIILSKAGLKSINMDKDAVFGILGRFILAPLVMFAVIHIGEFIFGNALEFYAEKTFIVQAAEPAFAIVPLLVGVSGGDEGYAANMSLSTTMIFILIIPLIHIFASA